MRRKVAGKLFLTLLIGLLVVAVGRYWQMISPETKAIRQIESGEYAAAFETTNAIVGTSGSFNGMQGLKLYSASYQSRGYARYLMDRWCNFDPEPFPTWAWQIVESAANEPTMPIEYCREACEKRRATAKQSFYGFRLEKELHQIESIQSACDDREKAQEAPAQGIRPRAG